MLSKLNSDVVKMFTLLLLIAFFETNYLPTKTQAAVVNENKFSCSLNEFSCSDGACVSLDHLCDGRNDCADGSDEHFCGNSLDRFQSGSPTLSRVKRQRSCTRNQWKCRDGTCIAFDGKCDGAVDCPDGSDETHALCRKNTCQSNWFRCTYGACVDGTARCNGVQECADNSDELHPKCQKTSQVNANGQFICDNGDLIPSLSRCDGLSDCADGSDETVKVCAAEKCPAYLFQCAYGACVDGGSDCDGRSDCADGSDENDALCNRIGPAPKPVTTTTTVKPNQSGGCILPPYPDHGTYSVGGIPSPQPGQRYSSFQINVTCNSNYQVAGKTSLYCFSGTWSDDMPKCVRSCRLTKHPSVNYRCLINSGTTEGKRECQEYEPTGTIVSPECNAPNYYSSNVLSYMRCIEGSWDYIAICSPECGRVTPDGVELVLGGRKARRGELPWHIGIYSKISTPYMQICGGSLVSTTVVISAAHCFWDETLHKSSPASNYAVAAGKIYRPWNEQREADAQKSDISDIRIPPRFQGASANYQEDIAIALVVTPFTYKTFIRPVCLHFDINFDRRQLVGGNMGKVAGWGIDSENGQASQVLKVTNLPYVEINECIAESPITFREYITSDKICAGFRNGTSALCKGDSGGGLAFPDSANGVERFFLRGIVSTVPSNENKCNAYAMTSFTHVTKHDNFIKEWLSV